ncbi:MAG: LamG domain-containing protein, partial [Minisyncoccales bacterium]
NPKIITAAATFDNDWHHLIVVATDSEVKIYMDGKRLTTTGALAPIISTSVNVKIGGWGVAGNYYSDGQIDEVRIYNRALTEAEVKYHYNRGGPVAQWDMDEGSGSVINDKSGNNNNGTLVNGATWAQGKHGSALSFDGTDDYVDAGNEEKLQITGSITISAWVKTNSVTTFNGIVTKYYAADGKRGYALEFNPYAPAGGGLRFILSNNGTAVTQVSTNQVLPNQWAYITGVYDGSSMKLFVDGVLRGSVSYSAGIYNTGENLFLGRSIGYASFNGQIDEVKIYDYARTEEEIRLDYNAGLATHLGPSGKTCSEDPAGCMDFGLAGHWDMDEGSGSIINDKSGNNNTCSLVNGPVWSKGKTGSALYFDGENDYADCNTAANDMSSVVGTVELWAKADRGVGYAFRSNTNTRTYIYRSSTGFSLIKGDPAANISFPSTPIGGWHHLVLVWDSGVFWGYQDGVQTASKNFSSDFTTSLIRIGQHGSDTASAFDGDVDEVKIYNRVLSAEEVRYHYNQGKPVAQWDFDEGEGTRAFDVSGNNNTGVLTNGPTWVEGKHGSALSFDGADDYVDC